MGCDIHGWVEVKAKSKWIAVKELYDDERNYTRFAALAGVRDYEDDFTDKKPKGIPDDLSDTVEYLVEDDGDDGHSHSWLEIGDAFKIFKMSQHKHNCSPHYNVYSAFDLDLDERKEYRLVFWFDN